MTDGDFTLRSVRETFGLQVDEQPGLFTEVIPVSPSAVLVNTLAETSYLALAIDTAKARAAMLITPVLLDLWRQTRAQISLFSGIECRVDAAQGLTGYCDYIISRSRARDLDAIFGILWQGIGLPLYAPAAS